MLPPGVSDSRFSDTAGRVMYRHNRTFLQGLDENLLPFTGDKDVLRALFICLDEFNPMFNILEP
ncbi:MAG: hypothetical protein ACI8P9_004878 [Parasphingorhabdus sp.]|jgi:hypothetical protein